ncbi:hypothetical protein SCT_0097 [Sulfuricella sp. T08]|uniref:EAL domain-containing protein n=1 Tax=Sulfuricella sp. T08 TaxID=1632857 RepID=UPI00061795D7|nr:EAL domain-containing protein [Sulfuricella sp. T08]GAO34717.1 hypothetical protein SCT_0097 [Sulfuricella sp. T08]
MKLSRLLILIIACLLALVFAGALAIVVNNSRDYLAEQMRSHAQDTATSLGLSLSSTMQNSNTAMMNSMADVIFDSGYYQEVVIRDISGKLLVSRVHAPQPMEVPEWFATFFVLQASRGHSLVMSGWKQLATVEVASHPGHAYRELWRVSRQAVWWIMGIGAASFILIFVVLRAALAPLEAMESLALGISNRRFGVLKKMPWARELRRVAQALNTMSLTVERMLGEQTSLAERLHIKAYVDGVTGLANGRDFRERLDHLLNAPEEFSSGALLFVHLDQLQAFNDASGHGAGNSLMQRVADRLAEICQTCAASLLARMNGAEFAILVPDMEANEAKEMGGRVVTALEGIGLADEMPLAVYVGIALYRPNEGVSALLSKADRALHAARRSSNSRWQLQEDAPWDESVAVSRNHWKSGIEAALRNGNIALQFQPVQGCKDKRELYREALVRIATKDGEIQPAGAFLPTVVKLGLAVQLDKLVVSRAMECLSKDQCAGRLAINLFASSILNEEFVEWLYERLAADINLSMRLVFEVPEAELSYRFDELRTAMQHLRQTGAQFAIDRFGHSATVLGHLRNLPVDFIKIDGSYIRKINQNDDKQFFVQAVAGIAHGVGMQVIAEHVETAEELATLQALGVDGVQGYFIGKPQA